MNLLDFAPATLDEYVASGGGEGLERALALSPERVIGEVGESGLRGRGGAGFPTGTKWDAIRTTGTGERFVVCNAAEGEPATFKDRLLLRRNPYRVIDGLAIAAHAVGAVRGFIVLKQTFGREIDRLARALEEMREAGGLGPLSIELVLGPDHYLLGEETGLLEVIEERAPLPRAARPYVLGLWAHPPDENPTAVNNVETLSNVPEIMARGPGWLGRTGTEESPGTVLCTVAGDVAREGVYEVPTGTSLRSLLEDQAGGIRDGRRVKVVFPGASSTVIGEGMLDVGLDYDAMSGAGTGLGAGGFAVYDETTCILEPALLFARFLHVESCGQCPPCKLNSADVVEFLEALEAGESSEDLDVALERARHATDGQKCALPTGTSLLVQSILIGYGEELKAHAGVPCPSHRGLRLPKITDLDEEAGLFTVDPTYEHKLSDWTYASPRVTDEEPLDDL